MTANAPATNLTVAKPPTEAELAARKANSEKQLTALIDAACVRRPDLKQALTVAAIWQYMQLPDSSFGWVPRLSKEDKRQGKAAPPLPVQAKALCIITTLELGLTPGLRNVLWLGTNCFIDIYGKRTLAARTPGYALLSRKLRKMTDDERDMIGLDVGDRGIVLEQRMRRGDTEFDAIGYGIIDANELRANEWGKFRAGMEGKKNIFQTLATRAERDILNRYFPIDLAIPDMPEDPQAFVAEQEEAARIAAGEPTEHATTIAAEITSGTVAQVAAAAKSELELAHEEFAKAKNAVRDLGGDVARILETDPSTILEVGDLLAAADVLLAWVEENDKPDPTPPPATKGKVGRPRKDAAKPELATTVTLAGDVTPPAAPTAEQAKAISDQVERDVSPEALDRKPAGKTPVPTLQDSNNPNPHLLGKARRRLSDAIKRVEGLGGAPMRITGINPHNVLEGTSIAVMEESSHLLEKWEPGVVPPADKHLAAKTTPPQGRDDIPPPDDQHAGGAQAPANRREEKRAETPAPAAAKAAPPAATPVRKGGTGPAYGMIERALGADDTPPDVRSKLSELAALALEANDHLYLPKAIRLAKAGDHRDLDELLGKRSKR